MTIPTITLSEPLHPQTVNDLEHTLQTAEGHSRQVLRAVLAASVAVAGQDAALDRLAAVFGVKPGARGVQFQHHGRLWTFEGVVSNRPKYPFNVRGGQGGRYKMGLDIVVAVNAAVDQQAALAGASR